MAAQNDQADAADASAVSDHAQVAAATPDTAVKDAEGAKIKGLLHEKEDRAVRVKAIPLRVLKLLKIYVVDTGRRSSGCSVYLLC